MKIESSLINRSGQKLEVLYDEADPMIGLEGRILQVVHAFCFYGDKIVVVYADEKKYWTPVGGGIEEGESYKDAVVREVQEESNMNVLHQELIGFQDVYEPGRIVRQTRSMCIVEPFGKFEKDPDGDITEMRLIDPKDYKEYFDWGVVGERLMKRALELKSEYESVIEPVS